MSLVPNPSSGKQDSFLDSNGVWKVPTATDLLLSSNGKWAVANTEYLFLRGNGNWSKLISTTNIPTIVTAPKAGDQTKFLTIDKTWEEPSDTQYFLCADGKWKLGNDTQAFLCGDGTWKKMELTGIYIYLYDGNTLHFSNRKLLNHGSHSVTDEWKLNF